MRRREFIALAAGAAAAPLAARAQQPSPPVVGLLDTSVDVEAKLTSFYEGLKIEGYVRNQTVAILYHAAESDYGRLPGLAADLVNRKVALIAAIGIPAALAAKAATATIPIVFAIGSDPVQIGLVPSLNAPGGNVTGVTNMAVQLEQKRLQLLHQVMPAARRFALLVNPTNPNAETQTRDAGAAADQMGLALDVLDAKTETDFDAVFASLAASHASGLAISNDGLFIARSEQLARLAAQRAVPAIFQYRQFAAAGGLMSYGSSVTEFYHQAGVYSGLVLKGAKAAELPVFQSTQIELILNLKAAKALGLAFPLPLLGRADQVIE